MAKDSSFDIVSDFDHQEMVNAVDQAKREIMGRYDFKGSISTVDFEAKEALLIHTEDDYRLKSIIDILESKIIKRGLSLKISRQAESKSTIFSSIFQTSFLGPRP